jgi:hypothetical protein
VSKEELLVGYKKRRFKDAPADLRLTIIAVAKLGHELSEGKRRCGKPDRRQVAHFLLGLGMADLADLMRGMKEGSEGRLLYETAASPAPGVAASLPNVMVHINDILNKLKRFSDS